jgi:hypothetical protein
MTSNLVGRTIVAADSEEIADGVDLLVVVLDDGTALGGLRVIDADAQEFPSDTR